MGGRVAQLAEHLTFNQKVPGSSPGALTNQIKELGRNDLALFCNWKHIGSIESGYAAMAAYS